MEYNSDCIEVFIDSFPASFYRISLVDRPNFPIPKRQHESETVLGRLGALHQHYSYEDMEIDLIFNYLEDVTDFKSFKQQMSNIRHWLLEGKKLELSDEPDVYYEIKHAEIDNVLNDIIEYGEFTVKLTLAPFGRVYEDNPITLPVKSNKVDTSIYNDSIENSFPIIVVTGSGNVMLRINNTTFTLTGVTGTIYIDSQLKIVYELLNGVPKEVSQKALSYEFPELLPEINQIYAENVTELKIYRNMMR